MEKYFIKYSLLDVFVSRAGIAERITYDVGYVEKRVFQLMLNRFRAVIGDLNKLQTFVDVVENRWKVQTSI